MVKPSEFTPATTLRLARLAHEAGLPAGVFNVAVGVGAATGLAVTTDRRVGKVSFIGSVGTGRTVAGACAQAGIPTVLDRVTADSTLETTEFFGPVVGADAFDSEEEAVDRVNATDLGGAPFPSLTY